MCSFSMWEAHVLLLLMLLKKICEKHVLLKEKRKEKYTYPLKMPPHCECHPQITNCINVPHKLSNIVNVPQWQKYISLNYKNS
jgi:hypothetical protein